MDIGDLFVLVVLAIGALSSLFGRKPQQKGQPGRKPARPPAPRREPGRDAPALNAGDRTATPASRSPRSDVMSHMEQILRELQLAPPDTSPTRAAEAEPIRAEPAPERGPPPVPRRRPDASRRPTPPPVPEVMEPEWEEVPEDYETYRVEEHEQFHEQFVKPLGGPKRRGVARGRRYLRPGTLRDAILASEILGKPVGLR